MKCFQLSTVFVFPAEVQCAGKNLPQMAFRVFELLRRIYPTTSVIPFELLKTELAGLEARAKEYLKTRQDPWRVVRYYADAFERLGILRVVDCDITYDINEPSLHLGTFFEGGEHDV